MVSFLDPKFKVAILVIWLPSCVSTPPVSEKAAAELKAIGIGYGVVAKIVPGSDPDTERLCKEGKGRQEFLAICHDLKGYNFVTVNVAATTGKSLLKSGMFIKNTEDVRTKDIIKFKFEDLTGFQYIASRGESNGCRWAGNSALSIGFPGKSGGIECEGWSYKSLLNIDWLNR